MRFTVKLNAIKVDVRAEAGVVTINGQPVPPHQAAIFGDALNHCAGQAEALAAEAVTSLAPVGG